MLRLLLWLSTLIGEDVNDSLHFDFGDNQFPHFLGSKYSEEDIEVDENSDTKFNTVKKYIPSSILQYIVTNV
jgi:hypothetical protein